MTRPTLVLAAFALCGCSPKTAAEGAEGSLDSESSSSASSSTGSSADAETTATETDTATDTDTDTDTETDTGEDPAVDACPASPALDSVSAVFDGWRGGIDYPEEADWTQTCTVVAEAGELPVGQTITLACVTEQGEAIEHTLELQVTLEDPDQPSRVPVEFGDALVLTLWSRVWFAGGATWVLRDAEQPDDIRLIYYSTIDLFEPGDFSPAPAIIEPLTVALDDDVCETVCPEPDAEETAGFVPVDECGCEREQAIEFVLGDASARVQNGSAGPIGASLFAFVRTAKAYPNPNGCTDHSGSWYSFLVVAR